jgi:peptide/nickel transport system permease protein
MGTIRSILQHKSGLIGLVLLSLLIIGAIFAPMITGDPTKSHLLDRRHPPSWEALLGTDQLGRDILTRIIWGARLSMLNGFVALAIGAGFGITVGAISSYLGRHVDRILMRVIDVMLAFPTLLLAVMTIAVLGPGTGSTAISIGVALIAPFARLTRGEVLKVKEWDFIEASRAVGATGSRLVVRHILPNVLSPIIIYATLQLGTVILAEASLTFLGLGPSPPTPSWGLMVNDGLTFIQTAWWISIMPGIAIFIAVIGVNFLGDALRDIWDPTAST